ncbi:MAG: ribosome maturation factor RimM [Candidatus Kapaibacteriota bacterium]
MEYILLGTIVGLKGLDGTVKVAVEDNIIPKTNTKVKIGYSLKYSEEYTIDNYKITTSKYNYLKLKEVDNIDKAKRLIEKAIFIADNEFEISSNSKDYSLEMGYKVLDCKTGEPIGTAIEIIPNPGNDLILVETPNGEFFLPFIELFVKKIDHEKKTIFVELIDGLIE